MLNDAVLDARLRGDEADERRLAPRIPVLGELVLRWLGHTGTSHRYRLVDRSEHGYRIYSTVPIPTGTAATVVAALGLGPDEIPRDDPVVVAWFRRADERGYDVGLRRLQP